MSYTRCYWEDDLCLKRFLAIKKASSHVVAIVSAWFEGGNTGHATVGFLQRRGRSNGRWSAALCFGKKSALLWICSFAKPVGGRLKILDPRAGRSFVRSREAPGKGVWAHLKPRASSHPAQWQGTPAPHFDSSFPGSSRPLGSGS